jgi:hypothetical protein
MIPSHNETPSRVASSAALENDTSVSAHVACRLPVK